MNLKKCLESSRNKVIFGLIIFFTFFSSIRVYSLFNPMPPSIDAMGGSDDVQITWLPSIPCYPMDLFCHLQTVAGLSFVPLGDMKVGGVYYIQYRCIDASGDVEWWLHAENPNKINPYSCVFGFNVEGTVKETDFQYSSSVVCFAGGYWEFTQAKSYLYLWYVGCPTELSGGVPVMSVATGSGSFEVTTEPPVCGDGQCDNLLEYGRNCVKPNPTALECESDCGTCYFEVCGNGFCGVGEDQSNCPEDCGSPPICTLTQSDCDDGKPCTLNVFDYANCKCVNSLLEGSQIGCSGIIDCSLKICRNGLCVYEPIQDCCGNGVCNEDESYYSCPSDCPNPCDGVECKDRCSADGNYLLRSGQCIIINNLPQCEYLTQESCIPYGCKPIEVRCGTAFCGNGICDEDEAYYTCPTDCEPGCGNGLCEYAESSYNCPEDCGLPPECTKDSNCNDNNECTTNECTELGQCVYTPISNCPYINACLEGEVNVFGACMTIIGLIINVIIVLAIISVVIYLIVRKK